jgi:hypothetical protein
MKCFSINSAQFVKPLKESLLTHIFWSVDRYVLLKNDLQNIIMCLTVELLHGLYLDICAYILIHVKKKPICIQIMNETEEFLRIHIYLIY